jgi:hypothetical protein
MKLSVVSKIRIALTQTSLSLIEVLQTDSLARIDFCFKNLNPNKNSDTHLKHCKRAAKAAK